MKVLLTNPIFRHWARPNCFPVGLGYIAAVLRNAGHEVQVLDLNALRLEQKAIELTIRDTEYDLFGTGGIVTAYSQVKELVRLSKLYHPDVPTIVGGSVSSSIPETLLTRTPTDIACIGEGEITVVEVAERVANRGSQVDLTDIAGIQYKDSGGAIIHGPVRPPITNLDALPFPAWDLFPMEIYLDNPVGVINAAKWNDGVPQSHAVVRSINISASRGCPYRCTYCYHDFMGTKYRHMSAARLVEQICHLVESLGVKYFLIQDDLFIVDRKFVYEFCDRIEETRLGVQWECASRANLVDDELLNRMKKAGCYCTSFGLESGSPEILKEMNKRVTIDQAENAIRLIHKHFGFKYHSMMIGMPSENLRTIQESIDFCIRNDFNPQVVFYATPYPGTELYSQARQRGLIQDEEQFVLTLNEQGENISCNMTHFTDKELETLKEYMVRMVGAANKEKH
jgi:anaerobic magnesium-protoporphyrin IX monomethyl ester cyclase